MTDDFHTFSTVSVRSATRNVMRLCWRRYVLASQYSAFCSPSESDLDCDQHFVNSTLLRCRFGNTSAAVPAVAVFINSTALLCNLTIGASAGNAEVQVALNGQQFHSSDVIFHFTPVVYVIGDAVTVGHAPVGTDRAGSSAYIMAFGITPDIAVRSAFCSAFCSAAKSAAETHQTRKQSSRHLQCSWSVHSHAASSSVRAPQVNSIRCKFGNLLGTVVSVSDAAVIECKTPDMHAASALTFSNTYRSFLSPSGQSGLVGAPVQVSVDGGQHYSYTETETNPCTCHGWEYLLRPDK